MFKVLTFFTIVQVVFCNFTIIQIQQNYSKPYTSQINKSIEYVLEYNGIELKKPPRISVNSSDATIKNPLMIVARTPQEMLSWQVPLNVESDLGYTAFDNTSRTLCHDILRHVKQGRQILVHDNPIVTISTSSIENISFTIDVEYQEEFDVELSKEYTFSVSPSQPRYYYYNFTLNSTDEDYKSDSDTVILEINSNDTICTTVSIQNVSCPVFDLNQDITFRGFYETINTRGGITIPKYKFPYGFYIVFVAKADDYQCTRESNIMSIYRTKLITFSIKPSITYNEYLNAVFFTLMAIGGFYVFFGLIFFFFNIRNTLPRHMEYVTEANTPQGEVPSCDDAENASGSRNKNNCGDNGSENSEIDSLGEFNTTRELRLLRSQPHLADLSKKHPKILKKESYLYLYNVLTVAIFYGLPVVQLVITYQKMLNETGQQDLCYYNFLCAHPLGFLSDFNHVFSNVGYIFLGILFLFITRHRELTHKDISFDREFGISKHYGLFYAMGVALIMEGILSGSYHVCPNLSNFQFDSSFMYVMAVLCMIKLYQNRHPDINASAYATFGFLAASILFGMVGIMEGNRPFWITFIVIYVFICFYLSIKIYYMGCWKLNRETMRGIYNSCRNDFLAGPINFLKPCYKGRFVLLLLGNLCNWGLALYALLYHPNNFAVFLLMIFMANTLLYFFFYILMKYLHQEYVKVTTWVYLSISTLCAITALYFFLHKAISWTKTPAQSRQFNKECQFLNFYDYHDIWHFLSAIGMFFTFMVLLMLDDDLSHTHSARIPVF